MNDEASLTRLQQRMKAIPKAVKEAVEPSLIKSGNELAGAMKGLAQSSRDSGDLIDSIAVTKSGQQTPPYSQPGGTYVVQENQVAVTAGNTDVRYAHLVEHGTQLAPAQPFFWPAIRSLQKRITGRTKRAISKAVKEHWGSQ